MKIVKIGLVFCCLLILNAFGLAVNIEDNILRKEENISIGYKDFILISPLTKVNRIKEEREERQIFFTECNDWHLDKVSANNIIQGMEKVEGSLAWRLCYYYPCWYNGTVSNGKKSYEITIYAHSAVTLTNDEETLFFILKEKSDLFIVPCDCCE